MESNELPLKAKPELILIPFLYFGVSALYLFPVLGEADSHYFLFDLASLTLWLINAIFSLPVLAYQKIQFTEDALVITRRIGEPLRLPYATYRQTNGDLVAFAGYTLNLALFQNKEGIATLFRQHGEAGLLPWKESAMINGKKVVVLILLIIGIVAFMAVTGYFAMIRHDVRSAGIVMLALAAIILITHVSKALNQRRQRVRSA